MLYCFKFFIVLLKIYARSLAILPFPYSGSTNPSKSLYVLCSLLLLMEYLCFPMIMIRMFSYLFSQKLAPNCGDRYPDLKNTIVNRSSSPSTTPFPLFSDQLKQLNFLILIHLRILFSVVLTHNACLTIGFFADNNKILFQ